MFNPGFVPRGRSVAAFQAALVVIALAVLLTHHFSIAASPPTATVWVADQKTLKQVDPSVNQFIRSLVLAQKAEALGVDPTDGALWALSNKHLLKFSAIGTPILDLDLKRLFPGFPDPKQFILDPYDGSLWVAGEKTFMHLSPTGQKLSEGSVPDNIKAFALDTDQTPWVLTEKQLLHLSIQGSNSNSLTLKPFIEDPKQLAVDGLGGVIWIGSEKRLVQFQLNTLTQPPLTVPLPTSLPAPGEFKIEVLGIHPVLGTLWVAGKDTLLRYDRNALYFGAMDLTPYALGKVETLAFEPISESLWLGGKQALGRFTPTGAFVAKLPAEQGIEAIGTGPFTLRPTLSLLAPPDASFTNNPRPTIRFGLGASCSGSPCTLVDAYLNSLSLTVDLNNLAVGPLFTLGNGEASYTPATRQPEGLNTLKATAKDIFGHSSEQVTGKFTIDTVAPRFLTVTPADGATLTAATAIVSGQVDDPTASVMLRNAAGTVLNVGNAMFSFSVTLAQGLNTFTLTAQDPAGNATSIAYWLTLNTLKIKITGPAPGSILTEYLVPVRGTLSPPPTKEVGVTVNGQLALVQNGQFSTFISVDSQISSVTATASDTAGVLATDTIAVTFAPSTTPALVLRATPAIGIAPLAVGFSLAGASAVAQVALDLEDDGTVEFQGQSLKGLVFQYSAPGLYLPKITVTDTTGTQHTASTLVQVYDGPSFDALLKDKWKRLKDALRQGNIDGALNFVTISKRPVYRGMFTALGPKLAQIDQILIDIGLVELRGVRAEYEMLRTDNGVPISHFVLFIMDDDGIWRVKFF